MLGGVQLKLVTQFKYLGHWATASQNDDVDVERERRALSVRSNMLIRSLWINCTKKAYSALRVLYNNAFRMLMGLPRYCSASGMFAEAHTDDFHAIMRKRVASLMRRARGSTNGLLSAVAGAYDSPIFGHWAKSHAPRADFKK
ncbi:uncharacterized protein LOC134747170 [Cydia strobilella]|uniref:uncharacterized protein LOC134747170 n=1 Tax=Cydia strobilella TaxID=1100964 RepID=UPI003006F124